MKLTEQNAKEIIVDASMKKAVFVFFYIKAPECDAAIKAVNAEIPQDNDFISLVEADVQEQVSQAIAMQIGLQSVPALIVMKEGRPAAVLEGDDVVNKLQETISQFMPSQAVLLAKEAIELEDKGDFANAFAKAKEAYAQDENNVEIKLVLARIAVKDKQLELAHKLLDNPTREEQLVPEFKDIVSALTLAEQAADSPALKELVAKFNQDPNNIEVLTQYAAALADAGKRAEALQILFAKLKEDLGNADVKKTFLDLLNTMNGDPLQKEYRRKLYTLMY